MLNDTIESGVNPVTVIVIVLPAVTVELATVMVGSPGSAFAYGEKPSTDTNATAKPAKIAMLFFI